MKQRMFNMDLCRVISMLGILTLHYNLSGVLDIVEKGSSAYWIAWLLEVIALCSVNIFAMMSGYLGWEKQVLRSKRLLELLLTALIECALITVVFLLAAPTVFESNKEMLAGLFPPLKGRLWYIVCFVPLFLFQPFINKLLLELTERQERNLCIVSLGLLGCIPSLIKVDLFHINNGYSFIWLAVCYSMGHYLRRAEKTINLRNALKIYAGGVILQCIVKVVMYYVLHKDSYYLMNYISPFIVLESVGAFMIFMKIRIENKRMQKVVAFLASFAFDVYIFHCHPLIFDKLIEGMFNDFTTSTFMILIFWFLFSILAYMLFAFLGFIRDKVFIITRLNSLIEKVSKSIDIVFNKGEK